MLDESPEYCKEYFKPVQKMYVDGQPQSLCCPGSVLLSDSRKRGVVVSTSRGAQGAVISTRQCPRPTTSQELQPQGALSVKGATELRTAGGVLIRNGVFVRLRTSEVLARLTIGRIEWAVCLVTNGVFCSPSPRDRSQTVTVLRINLRDLKI